MRKLLFALVILFAISYHLTAQESYKIAFYNVENLFDLVDNPEKFDEDFTPEGKQKWTETRYQKKLDQLAKVLEGMGSPDFFGLAEIENKTVLTDLVEKTALRSQQYEFVHFDSPDMRGIDVAFFYNKKVFKTLESNFIRIPFPDSIEKDYTSRDILQVKGILTASKDTLHFFINHWPSRRGGVVNSEPKRVHVAGYLKRAIDQIYSKNPEAKVIIMGDFNDETNNNSITKTLGASGSISDGGLYNCFAGLDQHELGSYNYRGDWNMLDQIIVSHSLTPGHQYFVENPIIFRPDWLMFQHDRFGAMPNRTYGGPNYYGGFSDHLAISVELKVGAR